MARLEWWWCVLLQILKEKYELRLIKRRMTESSFQTYVAADSSEKESKAQEASSSKNPSPESAQSPVKKTYTQSKSQERAQDTSPPPKGHKGDTPPKVPAANHETSIPQKVPVGETSPQSQRKPPTGILVNKSGKQRAFPEAVRLEEESPKKDLRFSSVERLGQAPNVERTLAREGWNALTTKQKLQVANEINEYKATEMEVHKESLSNTSFFSFAPEERSSDADEEEDDDSEDKPP